jgi:hypothetical protein
MLLIDDMSVNKVTQEVGSIRYQSPVAGCRSSTEFQDLRSRNMEVSKQRLGAEPRGVLIGAV